MALYKVGDVVRFRPEIVKDPDAHLKYGFNFEPEDVVLLFGIYYISKVGKLMPQNSRQKGPAVIQSYHLSGYGPFLANLDHETIKRYIKLRGTYPVEYFCFPEPALVPIIVNQAKATI